MKRQLLALVVKEAVRFSDPVYHQPEKIVITKELNL